MEGPYQKAQVQRKVLNVGKIWFLAKMNMFKNTRSVIKGDPEKSRSGIEVQSEVELEETEMKISLVGIH